MKISIVCGNHRQAESQKVMSYLSEELKKLMNIEVHEIDLFARNLPWWSEEVWEKGDEWNSDWKEISQMLMESEGVIFVTPEYGGMVPPILKNFFMLATNGQIAHKPGLIVSTSSGRNGVYPVSELRSSSYKNTKVCFTPDHLIIRDVKEFNTNPQAPDFDYLRERITYTLEMFLLYSQSLTSVRQSDLAYQRQYRFGM